MTKPDQKPPPRIMSDKPDKEISSEAMSETFEQLLERWDHYMAKSYYISLSDQKIIRTQLAAMRDELELAQSAIRDRQQTFEFGADVMNKVVLPRATQAQPDETALPALMRWVNERDQLRDELERVKGGLPDIGQDPNKMDVRDGFQESWDRLRSGLMRQQTGVPDQTALVWRQDISRVSDQLIIQRARGEQFLSAMKQVDELRTQLAEAKAELKEECQLVDAETVKRRLAEGQLADQSAKMASLEAQSDEFRDIAYQASLTNDRLVAKNERLESQAGAMREVLAVTKAAVELSATRIAEKAIGCAGLAENTPDPVKFMRDQILPILQAATNGSTQAGADQSARVQALEADKKRLEPRFDSLVLRCNRCKRLFYACMIRALRDADTFRDIASMLTAGATVELLEDKQELKRSEFGCKCEPAEYAALSQEQATPRND